MTINVFGAWVFVSISFSPEILKFCRSYRNSMFDPHWRGRKKKKSLKKCANKRSTMNINEPLDTCIPVDWRWEMDLQIDSKPQLGMFQVH